MDVSTDWFTRISLCSGIWPVGLGQQNASISERLGGRTRLERREPCSGDPREVDRSEGRLDAICSGVVPAQAALAFVTLYAELGEIT